MACPVEPQEPGRSSATERPLRRFDREKFLMRLVALILISEVSLFALAAGTCVAKSRLGPLPQDSICHRVDESLGAAFAVALNTLLALLADPKAVGESLRN
ncbi:MAG: hypothetical protein R6W06_12240 [Prochlorococcaceae cyanobacterium]